MFRKYTPKTLVVLEGVIHLETFLLIFYFIRALATMPKPRDISIFVCV